MKYAVIVKTYTHDAAGAQWEDRNVYIVSADTTIREMMDVVPKKNSWTPSVAVSIEPITDLCAEAETEKGELP